LRDKEVVDANHEKQFFKLFFEQFFKNQPKYLYIIHYILEFVIILDSLQKKNI